MTRREEHRSLPHGEPGRGAHHGPAEVMPRGGTHDLPRHELHHGISATHSEEHHRIAAPEYRHHPESR